MSIEALRKAMLKYAPIIGRPTIYNKRRKGKKRKLTLQEISIVKSPYPTLIIPLGSDSSVNHAICVVDDLIFDSTQSHAMINRLDAISWICDSGGKGVADVYEAFRFENAVNCSHLERCITSNW
jgi:hypothetical protein